MDDHAGYLKVIRDQAAAECEDRRRRTLAWPHLAAKLTDWPWRYEHPEQWNGYIPPAHTGTGAINDSTRRIDLIKLWNEVLDAEAKGEPPAAVEPPEPDYQIPLTEPPYLPVDVRDRDIEDVPLPEEPPEEDW